MTCPVCTAEAAPKTLAGFAAFECNCGFIFAAPGTDSSAPDLYDAEWSKQVVHPTYVFADGEYRGRNSWKQRQLLGRLKGFQRLNRILDVGCSAAFFLKEAQDLGWQVQGVEVTEWASTFSREKLGVPVFHGMLHEAGLAENSFDVAFSSHVLEHIEQPAALIRQMHQLLRPGGALVIVVPTQFRSPLYVLFKEWFGEGPPRHVSFFNQRSLTRLLETCGFRDVRCFHNVELQPLVRKVKGRRQPEAGEAAAAIPSSPEHTIEPQPGTTVRAMKQVINTIGGAFDISDEIIAIAVKAEGR
jgi:SAM-dependent methyltransferase